MQCISVNRLISLPLLLPTYFDKQTRDKVVRGDADESREKLRDATIHCRRRKMAAHLIAAAISLKR